MKERKCYLHMYEDSKPRGIQCLKCLSNKTEILKSLFLPVYLSVPLASMEAGLVEFSLSLGLRNQFLIVNHQLVSEKGLLTVHGPHSSLKMEIFSHLIGRFPVMCFMLF